MFRSIRWRLVISYMLLTLVTVSAVGVLAQWAVRRYAQVQETRYLTANAEAIARQALPFLTPQASPERLEQLVKTAAFLGNVRVRILDGGQRVLADSGLPDGAGEILWFLLPSKINGALQEDPLETWLLGLPPNRFPLRPEEALPFIQELPQGSSVTVVRRSSGPWGDRFSFEVTTGMEDIPKVEVLQEESGPRSGRVLRVPITSTFGRRIGFVELSAGTDYGAEAQSTTRRAFLLAGSAALILAGVLGWVMGKRISAPISSLTQTATRMGQGDLSVRAQASGKDETGQLAAQFNQMAGQLEASFEQLAAERDSLRRFIADASHELRTPITALKNFNELLQGAAANDPEARLEFLAESQVQIERLEWITSNLLDLSRLDAGLAGLEPGWHDLGEILAAAAAPFKSLAVEKGLELEAAPPDSRLEIHCDRARLEIALSNLLDNALKFTPQGGTVQIRAGLSGQEAHIQISDTGKGILPEDQPHIFERFYRGKDSTQAGSGLGLSIVQSIVQAHGGRISVDSDPGEGARFTIHWPAEKTRLG